MKSLALTQSARKNDVSSSPRSRVQHDEFQARDSSRPRQTICCGRCKTNFVLSLPPLSETLHHEQNSPPRVYYKEQFPLTVIAVWFQRLRWLTLHNVNIFYVSNVNF